MVKFWWNIINLISYAHKNSQISFLICIEIRSMNCNLKNKQCFIDCCWLGGVWNRDFDFCLWLCFAKNFLNKSGDVSLLNRIFFSCFKCNWDACGGITTITNIFMCYCFILDSVKLLPSFLFRPNLSVLLVCKFFNLRFPRPETVISNRHIITDLYLCYLFVHLLIFHMYITRIINLWLFISLDCVSL